MRVKYINRPHAKISRKAHLFACIYAWLPLGYLLVLWHRLFSSRKRSYPTEVSLCLIFKDEAPYLKEWLEYHLLIGVEHFYLYNNNSSDNYLEVLKPYIDRGVVTLTEWPKNYAQAEAYEDCWRKHRNDTHWLGYIDTDEFINLQQHNHIRDFLDGYRHYPSVLLYWRMFGTSGVMEEPTDYLLTECYTACWPWLRHIGKSFINNDYDFRSIWVHYHTASVCGLPVYCVNDAKRFSPFMEWCPSGNYTPKAYINHYWSKSRGSSLYKTQIKTDILAPGNELVKKSTGFLDFYELHCMERDYSIQRWLVLLKERMNTTKD